MTFYDRKGILYARINGKRVSTKLEYSKENIKLFKSYAKNEEFFKKFDVKNNIKTEYPEMWQRMKTRIRYIRENLNINISAHVLPMCSTVAYLRPYLFDKERALIVKRQLFQYRLSSEQKANLEVVYIIDYR